MDIKKLNVEEWRILMEREAQGLTKIRQGYENGHFTSVEPDFDLSKENCNPELWKALGGEGIDKIDENNLPF